MGKLRAIASRLRAECPEIEDVRLFGSLARGDHTGASDVDVLIVVRDVSAPSPPERALRYLPYFDLPIGTDVIVLTCAEEAQRLAADDPFVKAASSEGIRL
jgi:predicted nucleotidyltransferase